MIAPKSPDEEARLRALARYDILDTEEEEAFDDITRLVAHICDVPVAMITLVDRNRQFFKSEIGLGVRETPLALSACAHAILQPGLTVVPDATRDERFVDNPLVSEAPHLRFYAGAPLETPDGHALGTLCVLDYKTRELSEYQKQAINTLARQVMSLLELRRRYAREKNIAEALQRSMLLRPAPDQFPGLLVETFYEAAWQEASVGGDFFDAFALEDGSTALVVGDVAGKGLAAAARTAEAKYALRVYLRESRSPAEAVTRLNRFLLATQNAGGAGSNSFIALAAAVIAPSGATQVVVAGLESPLLARADGAVTEVPAGGAPVGVMEDAAYSDISVCLGSGDLLLMTTDGVTESRRGRELFGIERVEAVLREALPAAPPAVVAAAVVDAARAWGSGTFRDDVCLLVARRR